MCVNISLNVAYRCVYICFFLGVRSCMSYKYLYFSRGLNSHTPTYNMYVWLHAPISIQLIRKDAHYISIYIYINIWGYVCIPSHSCAPLGQGHFPPLNKSTTWGDRRMFEHPYKISSKAAHKYSYYVRMGAYGQIHL